MSCKLCECDNVFYASVEERWKLLTIFKTNSNFGAEV